MQTKSSSIQPSHAEIAGRARALWEMRGKPEGRDTEIWYDAERELLNEAASYAGKDRVGRTEPATGRLRAGEKAPPRE